MANGEEGLVSRKGRKKIPKSKGKMEVGECSQGVDMQQKEHGKILSNLPLPQGEEEEEPQKGDKTTVKNPVLGKVSHGRAKKLKFVPPQWFSPHPSWHGGKYCLKHNLYCLRALKGANKKMEEDKKYQKHDELADEDLSLHPPPPEDPLHHHADEMPPENRSNLKVHSDDTCILKKVFKKPQQQQEESSSYTKNSLIMCPQRQEEKDNSQVEGVTSQIERKEEEGKDTNKGATPTTHYFQAKTDTRSTFVVGQAYNIVRYFFTKSRDFLIKNNEEGTGYEKVKLNELEGKYILVLFGWLYDGAKFVTGKYGEHFGFNENLGELYRVYQPKGCLEVVFVAFGSNEPAFRDVFSGMPWLAIPHDDGEHRGNFKLFSFIPDMCSSMDAFLFDPDGVVVSSTLHYDLIVYGPEGFPFTDQKIKQMYDEADLLLKGLMSNKRKHSFTELFGDFVISKDGKQVPTSVLEDKDVGLFFHSSSPKDLKQFEDIVQTWNTMKLSEKYKEKCRNFEIVLVSKSYDDSFHLSKSCYKEKFGDLWYSLGPEYGKKLGRVFRMKFTIWNEDGGCFIMLTPDNYEFLSFFAYGIMKKFGMDAYPFTIGRAVQLMKIRQKKQLVLRKLLSPKAPLRGGGTNGEAEDTTLSKLSGKHILLLFATYSSYKRGQFLNELEKMYLGNKAEGEQFEVVYVSLDCAESPSLFSQSIKKVPYLIHAYNPQYANELTEKVFGMPPRLPAIAAFGADGHLITKESHLAFKKKWNCKFPFIRMDMGEEVRWELLYNNGWTVKGQIPPFPSVYIKERVV